MERLLIAGIDSVVGANMAAQLSDRFSIVGASAAATICIDGCETAVLAGDDIQAVRQMIASQRAERIVVCSAAGDSSWYAAGLRGSVPGAIAWERKWIRAADDLRIPTTLIASDAVFTGPWMFHTEASTSFCDSFEARALRAWETSLLDEPSPNVLVVRTHAYGWSPLADGLGWIEGIVSTLESERAGIFDCVPHASPILATDLAKVLELAWKAGLSGLYHIAGAERANPHRFASALAEVFELPRPIAAVLTPAESRRSAFALGESSLHTRKIRRALGVAMPLLAEGLQRLRDQRGQDYDRRFRGSQRLAASKVA